jgi:uncharacterized membrane protein
MNGHFVVAALAGMLTIAIVGGLLYGVVFAAFFRSNILALDVMKRPPAFGWIALSHVPFGLLLTLVVSWRGHPSARDGAVAGGLLGFLMAASYDFSQYGTMQHWTLQLTLVEPFIAMVMVAIAGGVVGAVLARGKRPSAS